MNRQERIISPAELITKYPLGTSEEIFINETRDSIRKILSGTDNRYLLIVGPCSIHHLQSAREYALRLKKLSDEVGDCFVIIMRTYLEKPRTTIGWKGLLHDPFLNGSHDIDTGLKWGRELLLELASIKIGAATEFLEFTTPSYLGDLISWGSIGARTCTSQPHRQLASGLSIPMGFKNSLDGDPLSAIHAVLAARVPQTCISISNEGYASIVRTPGNSHGHIVLRGAERHANYDKKSIHDAARLLINSGLSPRLIVDCSHGNCKKNYAAQEQVFNSLIQQILEGNNHIAGLMLESHLNPGSQPHNFNHQAMHHAISITDPCIGWNLTEQLILSAHQKLAKHWSKDKCPQADLSLSAF